MKITVLAENTSFSEKFESVHGLSLFIETKGHKLLFDVGPDNTFINNAEKLNVDLAAVDTVIISHGHYDHGGALGSFFEINDKAKVYIRENAFEPHASKTPVRFRENGIDPSFKNHPQVILTQDSYKIDDELSLFSNVERKRLISVKSNLLRKAGEEWIADDFSHEQNLIIKEGEKTVLICGCAHCGIANITDKATKAEENLSAVIGGFHLYNPASGASEDESLINAVADDAALKAKRIYTCHCTGEYAYEMMRKRIGERIDYLSSGRTIEL